MQPATTGSKLKDNEDGIDLMADAIYDYLSEIEECRVVCERHAATAAVHDRGKELQIYRMMKNEEGSIACLRTSAGLVPNWEESVFWKGGGRQWSKLESQVKSRMAKNKELLPILTQGIEFEGIPMLIHAYKYECDPYWKNEILVPKQYLEVMQELPLQVVASVLRCHELLVPDYVTQPLPPYTRHEAKFLTIWDYLSRKMPPELYATQSLPKNRALVRSSA